MTAATLIRNVSGGVRYLAWLIEQFHDFRLVAAAYFAGEGVIGRRGLAYRNSEVVTYVSEIRKSYLRNAATTETMKTMTLKRDVR